MAHQGKKYLLYMVIRERAAIRNPVIVILSIWKSMCGEIDSTEDVETYKWELLH